MGEDTRDRLERLAQSQKPEKPQTKRQNNKEVDDALAKLEPLTYTRGGTFNERMVRAIKRTKAWKKLMSVLSRTPDDL